MTQEVLTIQTLDGIDVQMARAGIGSRSYAFLIDWHIRLLAAVVWFAVVVVVFDSSAADSREAFIWGAALPSGLIYFLYHPVLEVAMRGQTPGKRWIHLRIVTTEGTVPGAGSLLLRNVFRILDSAPALYALGLLVMLCTRDQVRIGDLAAGTLVVYDVPEPKGALADAVVHDGVAARVTPLLEEWLERWPELDPLQRDGIARGLLGKAGVGGHESLGDAALRERVRGWLGDNARVA